jgi:hypothetical protein
MYVRLLCGLLSTIGLKQVLHIVSGFKGVQKFGKDNPALMLKILVLLLKLSSRVKS